MNSFMRILPIFCILAFIPACTPVSSETHEDLAEESLRAQEKLIDILRGVTDKPSAVKAYKRIETLSDEMKDLRRRGDDAIKMNTYARKKMEDKYGDRMTSANENLKAEFTRIAFKVDQGKEFVQKVEKLMEATLKEAKQK